MSQDEFLERWGKITFSDPSACARTVDPRSGYRSDHYGSFSRYSGMQNWYRPALWWEHLIAVTWGRLFWFTPKAGGWKHRWVVSLCDRNTWGLELREYRTKLCARIGSWIWLAKLGRGTFYTPGNHLELFDAYREYMVSRSWPL